MFAKLILWAIDSAFFSKEEKVLFISALMKRLGAIDPCGEVQVVRDRIYLKGSPLTQENMMRLRESAKAMLNSFARKLVRDIVLHEAYQIGFVTGVNLEQIIFARAAYWFGSREQELYTKLVTEEDLL